MNVYSLLRCRLAKEYERRRSVSVSECERLTRSHTSATHAVRSFTSPRSLYHTERVGGGSAVCCLSIEKLDRLVLLSFSRGLRVAGGRGISLFLSCCLRTSEADLSLRDSLLGLNTPLLFSNQALDLSPGKIRLFIVSYITTLTSRPASSQAITAYRNNLRLGQPYELAWFLRWALGRAVRLVREEHISPGADKSKLVDVREREVRGLVDWVEYEIWRGKERGMSFPLGNYKRY